MILWFACLNLGSPAVRSRPVQHGASRAKRDTEHGDLARLIDAHQLDPAVDTLAALAATLREQAAGLRAADEASEDWWTGYFDNFRREADAAERERAETDRLHALARSRR